MGWGKRKISEFQKAKPKSIEPVKGYRELTYNFLNSASDIPSSLWPSASDGYGLSGTGMNRCVSLGAFHGFPPLVVLSRDVAVTPGTSAFGSR